MLSQLIISFVICGQVFSFNPYRPISGNDNSGVVSNSGTANSGINSGTINYGINNGNENFGNHKGNTVYNNSRYGIANFGDHHGNNNFGSNYGNGNYGSYNLYQKTTTTTTSSPSTTKTTTTATTTLKTFRTGSYFGNDNSGVVINSGTANSGDNSGTINYGINNGNGNFGNHNGDNVYNSNNGINNFGDHYGNNNFGPNYGNGNYGSYNANKKTPTTTTTTPMTTTETTSTVTTTETTSAITTTETTSTLTTTTEIEETTLKVEEQECACNGEIDANNLGKCTKEDVWCYVDPQNSCNDSDVWTGEFGYGWTMSYQACETQLAMEHGECNVVAEKTKSNQTDNAEGCSCNGVVDSNNGGECLKPWVGRFWCYVDDESNCSDTLVWFGEFGFCQKYSFQACGFTNTSSVMEIEDNENTNTSTVPNEIVTNLTPEMTDLGDECFCSGVIDEDNLGKCTKKDVWCYVHPQAPCNDSLIWSGQFGYGWTYSYQACEAQLALTYEEECSLYQSSQTDVMSSKDIAEDGECSCNGEMDSNNGGECLKAWVGVLWCYVDIQSGCQDSQVWYGEFGFCQTYSFQACHGFNNKTVSDTAEEGLYRL